MYGGVWRSTGTRPQFIYPFANVKAKFMSCPPLNIGIIEDNRTTQALLKSYLEGKGHTVVGCAVDQDDALAMVQSKSPELVFLDVQLLTTSGFVVLSEINKKFPSTIVVMLSGYATPALIRAALDRGAFAYLCKPFVFDAIDKTLEDAFSRMLPLAA